MFEVMKNEFESNKRCLGDSGVVRGYFLLVFCRFICVLECLRGQGLLI